MLYLKPAFQFQTGSIKRMTTRAIFGNIAAFQFQTGSIKSSDENAFVAIFAEFQFQTGSIKRGLRITLSQAGTGFNSKLVRLKVYMESSPRRVLLVRFNSKLVRLKEKPSANSHAKKILVSIPNWFD